MVSVLLFAAAVRAVRRGLRGEMGRLQEGRVPRYARASTSRARYGFARSV
jgi:hypothetical protein